MNGKAYLRAVIAESASLGLLWWERLALILVVAAVLVGLRMVPPLAWKALANLKVEPQDETREEGGSTADQGAPLPTDPDSPGGDSSSSGG